MQSLPSYRSMQVFLVIMSAIGMGYALFFLQQSMGLSPCPLCIFQRIGLMVMGGFALVAAIFNPKSKLIWPPTYQNPNEQSSAHDVAVFSPTNLESPPRTS